VGVDVNTQKSECMFMSCHDKIMGKFKYLGTTVSYQNSIHVNVASRLNSGNVCYHSVKNIQLPAFYEPKGLIYRIRISPVD